MHRLLLHAAEREVMKLGKEEKSPKNVQTIKTLKCVVFSTIKYV